MIDESHDPTLKGRLDAAERRGVPVEVVVHLGHDGSLDIPPEAMPDVVANLVSLVQRESGERELDLRIFRNLSSFFVSASVRFVRRLAQRPEVIGIQLNRSERENTR